MTTTTTTATTTYKGRVYRLLWQGDTKYGQRAHLAFMDGSRDFWVDRELLGRAAATTTPAPEIRRPKSTAQWVSAPCVDCGDASTDCLVTRRGPICRDCLDE